ncbi:rCG25076 [Rattus norvegicus]|uniref:RCG25076 n=1 Tax=Rattus norvegicus TaxID=10116 RepID=A6I3Q1_RAT|nr:rCG25076 [Rattus norvegicus]
MAQQLRAPAALPEDPGSIPGTHMAAHNCNSGSRVSNTLIQTYETPMHMRYK